MTEILDPIDILWDGHSAIVVDKPAGLATQAPVGARSLESVLRSQLADRSCYLAFPHRLDRPVSGLVIAALTKKSARLLNDQFAARKVVKEYQAVVTGRVEIDAPWCDSLAKIPDQAKAAVVEPDHPEAKSAITRVEVVRFDATTNRTMLRLFPETGRMHQLRVQTASRGHPIVGDSLYGGEEHRGSKPADGAIMLRAVSLAFHDPGNGKRVTVGGSDLFGGRV